MIRSIQFCLVFLMLGCGSSGAPSVAFTGSRALGVPPDRPLVAGFLIVDGVFNSELTAPYDILQHTVYHTEPGIEVFTISPDGEPITTAEGLVITPHYAFGDEPEIDILVVPSTEQSMDANRKDEELIAWVRETGEQARWVMSLCDGAFVLAEAGLLDGRVATTFPSDIDRFESEFPAISVERGVNWVHDGRALTSVGGALSYDVAMYLVAHLYGDEVARGVGGGLIIDWPLGPRMTRGLVLEN